MYEAFVTAFHRSVVLLFCRSVSTNCLHRTKTSLHSLRFETDRRDGHDHFAELQLKEDRGLASCIKPNPPDPHVGLANQSFPWSCCCEHQHAINQAWSSCPSPTLDRRMRLKKASSRKIFWSSFSSKVNKCLFDFSGTLTRYDGRSASFGLSACCSDVAKENMSRNACNRAASQRPQASSPVRSWASPRSACSCLSCWEQSLQD